MHGRKSREALSAGTDHFTKFHQEVRSTGAGGIILLCCKISFSCWVFNFSYTMWKKSEKFFFYEVSQGTGMGWGLLSPKWKDTDISFSFFSFSVVISRTKGQNLCQKQTSLNAKLKQKLKYPMDMNQSMQHFAQRDFLNIPFGVDCWEKLSCLYLISPAPAMGTRNLLFSPSGILSQVWKWMVGLAGAAEHRGAPLTLLTVSLRIYCNWCFRGNCNQ